MVKPTSQTAYDQLDKPTLDDRVYDALLRNRNVVTRRELSSVMNEQASTVSGAVNRLIKAGLILVADFKVKCDITGRTVESIYPSKELEP